MKVREQGKVRFFGVSTHTNQAEVDRRDRQRPRKVFRRGPRGLQLQERSLRQAGHCPGGKGRHRGPCDEDHDGRIPDRGKGIDQPPSGRPQVGPPGRERGRGRSGHEDGRRNQGIDAGHGREVHERGRTSPPQILPGYRSLLLPALRQSARRRARTGVEISVVNRALMYAEGYRDRALAQATFQEASAASRCVTCEECVARCVNGLKIAEKMRRARSLFA